MLQSTPGSPKRYFPHVFHENPAQASPLPHTRYFRCPSHSSGFYHPYNSGWGVYAEVHEQ
jgi:hypothetical protein